MRSAAYATEAIRTRRYPGIAFCGDDYRRRAWVAGTGLDVWELIALLRDQGSERALADEYGLTMQRCGMAPHAQHEPLRLLLDADPSSHTLVRLLTERGADVVAADVVDELRQLDDPVLFAVPKSSGLS